MDGPTIGFRQESQIIGQDRLGFQGCLQTSYKQSVPEHTPIFAAIYIESMPADFHLLAGSDCMLARPAQNQ